MNTPSERQLSDFLEGQLSPEEESEFLVYLKAHPELETELDEMRSLFADASELPMPDHDEETLFEAHEALMSRIPKAPTSDHAPQVLRQFTAFHLVASSLAAVVLGVFLAKSIGMNQSYMPQMQELGADFVPAKAPQQEAAPLSRHFAVQDFAVQGDQSVRILFDETSQYEIQGRPEEADIQSYLGYILRNDANQGHRAKAVLLLDEHCSGESTCNVLIYALTQDPSVEVRREAAMALVEDRDRPLVKQAYLKMMSQDPAKELRDFAMAILAQEAPMHEMGQQGGTR